MFEMAVGTEPTGRLQLAALSLKEVESKWSRRVVRSARDTHRLEALSANGHHCRHLVFRQMYETTALIQDHCVRPGIVTFYVTQLGVP